MGRPRFHIPFQIRWIFRVVRKKKTTQGLCSVSFASRKARARPPIKQTTNFGELAFGCVDADVWKQMRRTSIEHEPKIKQMHMVNVGRDF